MKNVNQKPMDVTLRRAKMKMRKRMSRSLAISAVAGIVALAGSSAAFAASSYNVTAGSAPASTVVGYTATTTGALPHVTFTDTTSGTVYNCASASATGTITVGTNLSWTGIGTVDGTGWNTCTGPFGLTLTHTGVGSWNLDATGDTVGGVTPVSISGVNLHVSDPGGSCDFDYTGSVNGTYTNGPSNGTLTLPGTSSGLTIKNVSGSLCAFAGISNGHSASFKATYQVVADNGAYNPIQIISSP